MFGLRTAAVLRSHEPEAWGRKGGEIDSLGPSSRSARFWFMLLLCCCCVAEAFRAGGSGDSSVPGIWLRVFRCSGVPRVVGRCLASTGGGELCKNDDERTKEEVGVHWGVGGFPRGLSFVPVGAPREV